MQSQVVIRKRQSDSLGLRIPYILDIDQHRWSVSEHRMREKVVDPVDHDAIRSLKEATIHNQLEKDDILRRGHLET